MPPSRKTRTAEPEPADVAVVGRGMAAVTAAALLARAGRRVLRIVDAGSEARTAGPAWVNLAVDRVLDKLGGAASDWPGEPVGAVAFHLADSRKHQEVETDPAAARLIDIGAWSERLARAAPPGGVTVAPGESVDAIRPQEQHVRIQAGGGREWRAAVLIAADGVAAASEALLGGARRPDSPARVAVQLDWSADKASKLTPGVLHFGLGGDRGATLSMFWAAGGRETATAYGADEAAARATLDRVLAMMRELWAVRVPAGAAPDSAACWSVAAGHAMELESHVGKRTLVIGEAGGFVSATTCEAVYPGMWSAEIAADVINAALGDSHPQDSLRHFDTQWRTTMAGYLSPPNSDLRFLLPLVFSNKQMAQRLANSYLRGEAL